MTTTTQIFLETKHYYEDMQILKQLIYQTDKHFVLDKKE